MTTPLDDTLRALDAAHAQARTFLETLSDRPVSTMQTPDEMAAALDEPLPTGASDPADIVGEWMDRAGAGIIADPGPRYFGFVNGGVTPAALAGDWIASTIDQNAALWVLSPAAAQTELVVLRWLKELFALPPEWTGIVTSGGTMSNLIGLAAARQWEAEQLGFNAAEDGLAGNPPIHVVSSSAIHASAIKSLGTLGMGRSTVTQIPTTDGTMDIDALRDHLSRIDGPAIIIGNAGEVNTGQFDDLAALADLRDRHPGGAWLHVDGAFGLFAAASPTYAHLVEGIDRADSVASDAHKWLNVPYDCGFAFVRDAAPLHGAFSASGAYLTRTGGFDADAHNPFFSRRFRALAAWCSLKSLGRDGYRDMVERCIANARDLADWVDRQPGMELVNGHRYRQHPFNIVCFRFVGRGVDDETIDNLNRRAVEAIQRSGRAFVSGTSWNGHAAIRAAFVNWTTTLDDVAVLKDVLQEMADTSPEHWTYSELHKG
ncbi:MAG TPA: pyridoxal-dependent decarboxylase [Thermomicrobiales bacterium]|nr:pyridoxal-dependent decarboxylase [Thermomicrobiales bacterium]